jgi:hypothetical protein
MALGRNRVDHTLIPAAEFVDEVPHQLRDIFPFARAMTALGS